MPFQFALPFPLVLQKTIHEWQNLAAKYHEKMKQSRRAVMTLIGNQARLVVVAEIFATLKELVVKKHIARDKGRLRVRAEEWRGKCVLAMTEGQAARAAEVLRCCFIGWKKHLGELRKDKIHTQRMMAL